MKRYVLYFLIVIFIIISHIAIYTSTITKTIDYKIYDFSKELFKTHSNEKQNSHVLIVDIDEESLNAFGQWPWPRILLAQLVSDIHKNQAATIALDIIFPEEDRTSPKNFSNFYETFLNIQDTTKNIPASLQDNDLIFANALQSTQSVLSIYLSQKHTNNTSCAFKNTLQPLFSLFDLKPYPFMLCNTQKLSSNKNNIGFINTKIDEDGLLRRYQIVRKYKDTIIPSLALASLQSIDPNFKQLGDRFFEIMGHTLHVDKSSNVLLNFYNQNWYKKISAKDILQNKVAKKDIAGKIVLIGSSAVGLYDRVIIPGGQSIAGVKVHATFIDNFLHDDLLVQPTRYTLINILFSLLLTLVFFVLLIKKHNNTIPFLFTSAVLLSLFINIYSIYEGLYLSLGYFLVPLLIHFFIISIIFIFIDTYDRKVFSEELNRSHVALLDSMVHVAEVHDIETGAHIIRTKLYIKVLAEHMHKKGIYGNKLNDKIIKMMYLTASMHDIGKVGIPDSVLKKAGSLTTMEYAVMQTHPDLGKHIINNAISSYNLNDFFLMARNIVAFHHEKWDGTGYPNGLKGEEIPLEARFMAIADVYDALVSKRVYKEAFSYEKSITIIAEGRAKHFDPMMVDAFLEIQDEFKKIAQTHRDDA